MGNYPLDHPDGLPDCSVRERAEQLERMIFRYGVCVFLLAASTLVCSMTMMAPPTGLIGTVSRLDLGAMAGVASLLAVYLYKVTIPNRQRQLKAVRNYAVSHRIKLG